MGREIKFVGRDEEGFPEKLSCPAIKPPVKGLWYRGELDPRIWQKCAAVVGSRKMSRYGKQVLGELIPRLVGAGYTIVSGLMYGVDQEAHRLTLECGGVALAVLGYGIGHKSEEGAFRLAQKIEEKGLLLSEYEGDARGQTWTFPQRNRLVVGLSDVVFVVEAGERSGSLNTASWAVRMKKKLYAVPGSVFSNVSMGTNKLIESGTARVLTTSTLASLLGQSTKEAGMPVSTQQLGEKERLILTSLKLNGPSSINELTRSSGLNSREVLVSLASMEMRELVWQERGVWSILY